MARFNISASMAVLLVTMFAIAAVEASIYRTTVTTTEIEDAEDNQQSQRCQRQMCGMRMNMCQQYLRQSSQRGDDIMMEEEINPTRQGLQDCCREMRGVSDECRCEAVRQMVQQMQGQAYQGQMMQKARQLPSMCGMRPQSVDDMLSTRLVQKLSMELVMIKVVYGSLQNRRLLGTAKKRPKRY